jgi:RNA polymerase sigma-70 factor, ECF subfamily
MNAGAASSSPLAMTDTPQDSTPGEEVSGGIVSIAGLLVHQELVFRVCLGHAGNYAEAEDLAQEVYLKAHQSLARLKDPSSAREWLLRIARNACLDHQKRNRRRRILLRLWGEQAAATLDASISDGDLEARIADLKSAVRRLPRRLRDIFVLREYGHLTYEELAAALSLKKGTVMSRLNRARGRIAAALQETNHDRP